MYGRNDYERGRGDSLVREPAGHRLSWTRHSKRIVRVAGSAGLAGYNIYYGNSPTSMTRVIAVNGPSSTSYQINSLSAGTWYFAVAAYNEQAEEGPHSGTVSKTI